MNKRLDIDNNVASQLRRAAGEGFDTSSVAVFEATAINNRPLPRKNGTLFEGAVFDDGLLQSMASQLNRSAGIPLQIMHDTGSLPTGRAFYGDVRLGADGRQNLHVLFYVPLSESDIVNKIETSVIDEVSVQVLAEHLYCSKCGFDYLGADAGFEHLWTRTCANGHEIGKDGTHVRLVGLDEFLELSLVAVGGADNAKIVSRAKSKLAPETMQKLAANSTPPEIVILTASADKKETTSMSGTSLDSGVLLAQVTDLSGQLGAAKAKLVELEATTTTVAALNAQVAELTATVATGEEVKTKLAAAEKLVETATASLSAIATRVLVANGEKNPNVSGKSVEDLVQIIDEGSTKLAALIPAGGRGNPAEKTSVELSTTSFSAFKSSK